MPQSLHDLKEIVRLGGGVSIDAATKAVNDLKDIARLAGGSGSTIILRNAGGKTARDLKDMARLAPGKIIFEF